MTEFLLNLIAVGGDEKYILHREKYGYLGSVVGIGINLILFFLKFFVGIIVKSISVTADAFNNLSDTLSSLITLVGFKLGSMPADEDHPYGHGRIEYFSGLIVSMLVLYVGISFLVSSVKKIINPEVLEFKWIPVILLILSILSKIWIANFNKKLGDKINSNALKASALDAKGDVMISSTVVIGLLLSHFLSINLDGYFGLFVAFMIIKSAAELIKDTINPLLGDKIDDELLGKIEDILMESDEIFGVHDTIVHNYGPNTIFGTTHVEVRDDIRITEIHDIIDSQEKRIKKELGIELVIHMDPIMTKDKETIKILKNLKIKILSIEGIRSIHDMRIRDNNFYADIVIDPKKSIKKEDELLIRDCINSISEIYPEITCHFNKDFDNIIVN